MTSKQSSEVNSVKDDAIQSPASLSTRYYSLEGTGTASRLVTRGTKSSVSESSYALVSTLCCFAAMGGFMFGYDTGTISGYINMPQFLMHFGQLNDGNQYHFSKVRSGLIVSVFSIGACIGGIFFARTADMFGRRVGIMIGCVIYVLGVLIQITAMHTWYQFMIGRILGGMGGEPLRCWCRCFSPKRLHEKFVEH